MLGLHGGNPFGSLCVSSEKKTCSSSWPHGRVTQANVTDTVLFSVSVTVHCPVPAQAPPHPGNMELLSAIAVRVTEVPASKLPEQDPSMVCALTLCHFFNKFTPLAVEMNRSAGRGWEGDWKFWGSFCGGRFGWKRLPSQCTSVSGWASIVPCPSPEMVTVRENCGFGSWTKVAVIV